MRSAGVLAVLAAVLSSASASAPADAPVSPQVGSEFRLHLASSPFPDPRRESAAYQDNTTLVYVPKSWTPSPPSIVVFFHGWYSSVDDAMSGFELKQQLDDAGAQALLVVPELAKNAADSFGGRFEDRNGFRRYLDELTNALEARGLLRSGDTPRVILSGHSGGYRVIGRILAVGGVPVSAVVLFDALYGQIPAYLQWLSHRQGHLYSVYVDDTDTEEMNQQLVQDLTMMGIPLEELDESDENRALPSTVLAAFYRSRRDHYGVVDGDGQWGKLVLKALAR